ncbi:hypothetical protein ACVINZ_006577 [Mesorhizobium jarvisii]
MFAIRSRPTVQVGYGVSQQGLDLLAQYYRDEITDADIEAQDADLLTAHDKASEACLSQFPAK